MNVTFIGKDDNYELVTPELLSNFDLITSIEKNRLLFFGDGHSSLYV